MVVDTFFYGPLILRLDFEVLSMQNTGYNYSRFPNRIVLQNKVLSFSLVETIW